MNDGKIRRPEQTAYAEKAERMTKARRALIRVKEAEAEAQAAKTPVRIDGKTVILVGADKIANRLKVEN